MQEIVYFKVLLSINIHSTNHCKQLLCRQQLSDWFETAKHMHTKHVDTACVLKVRTVFYDTQVKKLAMDPKYFCFL